MASPENVQFAANFGLFMLAAGGLGLVSGTTLARSGVVRRACSKPLRQTARSSGPRSVDLSVLRTSSRTRLAQLASIIDDSQRPAGRIDDRFNVTIQAITRQAAGYAACRHVDTLGSGTEAHALMPLREYHDTICAAERDLPLA